MEVRLWHEFARYVSLIAAKTTEGRSLFAPALLCEHSRNECPDLQVYNDGVEVGKPKPWAGFRFCNSRALAPRSFDNTTVASDRESQIASLTPVSILFRDVLARAAGACGLRLVEISEKSLPEHAKAALAIPASKLSKQIATLGKSVGPPWGKDQKDAALVAMIALAARSQ